MALASSRPLGSLLSPSSLFSLLSLLIPLVGCSEGEDTDSDSLTTAVSLASTASADESAGSTAPTTAELPAGTTTETSTTTTTGDEPTGSSTVAVDTTTGDDSSTGGTTGPICDAGQVGCICIDGTCADGLVCELGVCEPAPMVCPGDLEPGDDDEESAKNVGDITDNDNDQFGISGVLSGAADTDWYTYHGSDKAGYVAEPTLTLVQGNLRLCQFLACDEGGPAQTELTCPEGSKFAISPTLRPGCCAATSFSLKDFNCSGAADDVTVWIRVDKPTVDECTNYELKVNF